MSNQTLPALPDTAYQFFAQLGEHLQGNLDPERSQVALKVLYSLVYWVGDLMAENESLQNLLTKQQGLLNAYDIMRQDDHGDGVAEGIDTQMDHYVLQIADMVGCSQGAAIDLVLWFDTMSNDPAAPSGRALDALVTLTQMAIDREDLQQGR